MKRQLKNKSHRGKALRLAAFSMPEIPFKLEPPLQCAIGFHSLSNPFVLIFFPNVD
jgi:hypothetical protein